MPVEGWHPSNSVHLTTRVHRLRPLVEAGDVLCLVVLVLTKRRHPTKARVILCLVVVAPVERRHLAAGKRRQPPQAGPTARARRAARRRPPAVVSLVPHPVMCFLVAARRAGPGVPHTVPHPVTCFPVAAHGAGPGVPHAVSGSVPHPVGCFPVAARSAGPGVPHAVSGTVPHPVVYLPGRVVAACGARPSIAADELALLLHGALRLLHAPLDVDGLVARDDHAGVGCIAPHRFHALHLAQLLSHLLLAFVAAHGHHELHHVGVVARAAAWRALIVARGFQRRPHVLTARGGHLAAHVGAPVLGPVGRWVVAPARRGLVGLAIFGASWGRSGVVPISDVGVVQGLPEWASVSAACFRGRSPWVPIDSVGGRGLALVVSVSVLWQFVVVVVFALT